MKLEYLADVINSLACPETNMPPHSRSLVDKGLRNAARFTMEKMIGGYCDTYEKAIAEASGGSRR